MSVLIIAPALMLILDRLLEKGGVLYTKPNAFRFNDFVQLLLYTALLSGSIMLTIFSFTWQLDGELAAFSLSNALIGEERVPIEATEIIYQKLKISTYDSVSGEYTVASKSQIASITATCLYMLLGCISAGFLVRILQLFLSRSELPNPWAMMGTNGVAFLVVLLLYAGTYASNSYIPLKELSAEKNVPYDVLYNNYKPEKTDSDHFKTTAEIKAEEKIKLQHRQNIADLEADPRVSAGTKFMIKFEAMRYFLMDIAVGFVLDFLVLVTGGMYGHLLSNILYMGRTLRHGIEEQIKAALSRVPRRAKETKISVEENSIYENEIKQQVNLEKSKEDWISDKMTVLGIPGAVVSKADIENRKELFDKVGNVVIAKKSNEEEGIV